MAKDVFISYSRKDLKQVIGIRDELKELSQIDSWIDLKGIESGEQFVNVIISAIDEAMTCIRKAVKQGYEEAGKLLETGHQDVANKQTV